MKIGIFGHSRARFRNWKDGGHYSQKVDKHFSNYQINWYGYMTSSLERIVFEIDKHKNFDMYVIFHTDPYYLYFPGWPRDFPHDVFLDAVKSEKGYNHFLSCCERYDINLDNIKDRILFYKDVIYNSKIIFLKYYSNLYLLRSLIKNKKTIHIKYTGFETKIFKDDYFSEPLASFNIDPAKDIDNELFSKTLISEIEKILDS